MAVIRVGLGTILVKIGLTLISVEQVSLLAVFMVIVIIIISSSSSRTIIISISPHTPHHLYIKLGCLMYKSLCGQASQYLADDVQLVVDS